MRLGAAGYINANLLSLPVASGVSYPAILAQGPLEHTTADFWQLVWEQGSKVLIMVTNQVELGKEKCHGYWPPRRKKKYTFRNFEIENLGVKKAAHFHASSLLLREQSSGEVRPSDHTNGRVGEKEGNWDGR